MQEDIVTASELIQYYVETPTEQLGYIDHLYLSEFDWQVASFRVSMDHRWIKKHLLIPRSLIKHTDVSSRRVFLLESLEKIQPVIERTAPLHLHLHTIQDLQGFEIHTQEKNFGKLEDLLLHRDSWIVQNLILNTHKWLGWKYILIRPDQVQTIAWNQSKIHLSMHESEVLHAPEFTHTKAPFQTTHWYG